MALNRLRVASEKDANDTAMQRISSRATFFQKRVMPILLFGFLLLFVALPFSSANRPPLPFLLGPAIMAVFIYFMMKKIIFDLVDEAWDAGDALIVRNKDQEDRIPLSEIMNVSYSPLMSPPRVTLWLRTPGPFGEKVSFCAPLSFIPFASSPLIDDLIKRIDVARQRVR